ncbi:hypothetical protein BT96DRAFT_999893 [Gymnopus androsaceus JB14]|uniref:Uncharacterized protein n=1 Tax=Gymnopus androsaceus JB14 TaxID=1447944 RepID=A0A6A4H4A1_9AGAR|nr:hypothetical protein BT96DRAFT_999893 [Gymnopus androsaceus JB14]
METISSTEESEPAYNGNPTEDDIFSVREFFLRYLPLKLIDLIFGFAEYWPCIGCDSNHEIDAAASRGTKSTEAIWIYLMSPPIPPKEESSKDRKDGEAYQKTMEHITLDLTSNPTIPFNLGTNFNSSDLEELFPEPNPNRWHIQKNIVASRERRFHSVTWTEFEDENLACRDPTESLHGREGFGHELVRSLEPGDRVMLIAKARFPGWSNHVFRGSIEIYYSV